MKVAMKPVLVILQEWRHAHGMRCLGIPNTAHFANVTQIEDAVSRKSCPDLVVNAFWKLVLKWFMFCSL